MCQWTACSDVQWTLHTNWRHQRHYTHKHAHTRTNTHTHTHAHTQRFLSGCEAVENRTSQLAAPHTAHNFPTPLSYTTRQVLEYTPIQCLMPTHMSHFADLYINDSKVLANILDLNHWPPQHSFARTKLQESRKLDLTTSLSVRLRALSRSHFLIDFHQNWHRRKYPQKEERVR